MACLGLPQWLQLDLGTQVSINEIVTHFYDGTSRVYTYYIQVSSDGSNWYTVVSTKTGSSTVTDTFNSVTCRYVQVVVTGNTANTAAHIEQVTVYQTTGSTDPAPAPTPSPAPTPAPVSSSSNALALTGFGGDYLVYFSNGDAAQSWYGITSYYTQYHVNTARLGMSFSNEPSPYCSIYDRTKMVTVLSELGSVGVKSVLTDQAILNEPWYGSQAWVNDWVQVAIDLKGNPNVEAFQLMGEPYSGFLSPTGPTGGVRDVNSLNAALAYCIEQIRAVDPT